MKRNKLLLLLALLLTAATGAWATDYTTLAVGDVIKVGDTFSPTDDGVFNNNGVSSGNTYSLMRADIDNDYNVTEKTDGEYYVFKFVSEMSSPYIHFEKAFAVTAISDGLEVTNIETVKGGKLFYTLAVHESAAPAPAAIFAIDTDGTTQDFGSVELDATAQKTFTITNSGNKPLYVTISNPADFTAEMTPNDNANVYFTDALGWGDIQVYYWPNGPEWPGVAMTELYTNELGQKVYCYKLPADVEGVIFNGNGNQTGDINGAIGKAYYTTGEKNGSYFTVGTWSYNNCVPAGMSRVLTVTMNTATLGSKSGNITLSFDAKNATSFTIPCTGKTVTYYNVTMADGTEDADNWTITPKQGLSEGDQVTITYTGSKRVKSVKAVKEDPSVTKVTTFSELQTALSAGKNVKLKNDIVCTAEIEISSDGALTIDGNGKKLSTTSAIRAFTVKSSATVAFKNLTLTGFVSGGGPAINNSGTIVLDGCTISNCHVNNSNGGGAIESSGKLYAINTTFSGNYSGEIGGAINNAWGSLYMIGCTFTNNYTTSSNAYYGGAIGINRGNEVRLINCVFSENKYGTNTGTNDIGVFNNPTNYTIAGCTGATIASRNGDITTIASGTATLDYSDLSNIAFTYNAE